MTVDDRQLRLSVTFSGDETAKGDCKYDLWCYEVDCLTLRIPCGRSSGDRSKEKQHMC